MANRKISDLTALTTPATGDLLPIVDISEAAAADKNKKITFGELFASIPAGIAAAPSVAFEGYNTGIYSPGADQVAISTNGTGRLFVDASGNVNIDSNTFYVDAANNRVGIGTTGPGTELHVAASSGYAELRLAGASGSGASVEFYNSATQLGDIFIDPSNNMVFRNATERMRINSAGDVSIVTGNLIIGTAGKGIDFSADGSAAGMTSELLDDYEEGTWTPSVGGTATYNARTGNYVKIGKVVYIDFYIDIILIGTGSTTLMTGAPFNCTNTAVSAGSTSYQANLATAVVSLAPQFNSSTQIRFDNRTAAQDTASQNAVFKNSTAIYGSVTYLAS